MKAFPSNKMIERMVFNHEEGMDLRDYFAAAFLANKWCAATTPEDTAKRAYQTADEMMKVREK